MSAEEFANLVLLINETREDREELARREGLDEHNKMMALNNYDELIREYTADADSLFAAWKGGLLRLTADEEQ